MRVLFVCTGNICRSPIGELLFRMYTAGTSIEVDSAGTHSLVGHEIDGSSAALLTSAGIDSSAFRSKQLTRQIAQGCDLILCFEEDQLHNRWHCACRRALYVHVAGFFEYVRLLCPAEHD